MITGLFVDMNGELYFNHFSCDDEAYKWFSDNGINLDDSTECTEVGWNPCPVIITGTEHCVIQFDSYEYDLSELTPIGY